MANTGNICVFDNKIQGGFTQISQWVTIKCMGKKEQKGSLGIEALGLYTLLKSLPPYWVTSVKLMSVITGLSEYKIRNILQDLGNNNMLRRMERFEGGKHFHYFLFNNEHSCEQFDNYITTCEQNGIYPTIEQIMEFAETLNIIEDDTNIPDSDIDTSKIQHYENFSTNIQSVENFSTNFKQDENLTTYTILDQYNTKNKNNIIYNNISINKVDCGKTSQNNFKPNIKKPFSIKKSDVISSSYHTKPNLFSLTETGAAEVNLGSKRRNKDVVKNKVQLMEIEKGDSISTMDTQGFKNTMGDLTAEDNQMARVTHSMQEFLALEKKVNKTNMQKMTRLKQLKKEISKLGANPSVASNLETYVESYMDTYGLLATASLHAKYDKLKAITYGNPDMMNAIINDAIQGNWKDFHVSDDIEKKFKHVKNDSIKNIQTVIDTNDDDDYAVDDNGNLLQY